MAVIDILGAEAYGRFNRKFAKLVGLQTAVYTSEIMNILFRVRAKQTYDPEGFWKIDRKYVESQTTLSVDDQLKCDETLKLVGIIDKDGRDKIRFRADSFFNLILENTAISEDMLKKIKEKFEKPKLTPKEARMLGLNSCITETDSELLEAYTNWVEAINENRKITKVIIQNFIDDINARTTDKNEKLRIIRFATQAGYSVAEWCFKKCNLSSLPTAAKLPEQKISNGELDMNNSF